MRPEQDLGPLDSTRINPLPDGRAVIPGVAVIVRVHRPDQCRGQACTVHNPSGHHMRSWPMDWDAGLTMLLRQCPHGQLHPDLDEQSNREGIRLGHIFDCDGCCHRVFNEGFTPADVECKACREASREALRKGRFADLADDVVAVEMGHLVAECGYQICGLDEWAV